MDLKKSLFFALGVPDAVGVVDFSDIISSGTECLPLNELNSFLNPDLLLSGLELGVVEMLAPGLTNGGGLVVATGLNAADAASISSLGFFFPDRKERDSLLKKPPDDFAAGADDAWAESEDLIVEAAGLTSGRRFSLDTTIRGLPLSEVDLTILWLGFTCSAG